MSVDGQKAVQGQKVLPEQKVYIRGELLQEKERQVLLLFHKPRGVVCTFERRKGQINIEEYLKYPVRVTYAGRLDKESEGLLLLTNCGDLINKMMRAGNYHEKEYIVKVDRPVTADFVRRMSEGVPILDTVTRPCKVKREGKYTFRIILTQGLNRQIRRMCEYLGYEVKSLKRIRIMRFELGDIPNGGYREATKEEWLLLEQDLKASYNDFSEMRKKADDTE